MRALQLDLRLASLMQDDLADPMAIYLVERRESNLVRMSVNLMVKMRVPSSGNLMA